MVTDLSVADKSYTRRPGELLSADDVNVEVVHALAPLSTIVDDGAVSCLDEAFHGGDFGNDDH